MTISIPQIGATRSTPKAIAGTSANDVLTAPSKGALFLTINVANTTGSAVTATVNWYRASDTTAYSLRSGFSIAANTSTIVEFPVEMAAGDKIQVTASTGSALVAVATWLERMGALG